MKKSTACSIIEVDLPEIAAERLEPLIDLLTDLFSEERLREVDPSEEEVMK